MSIINIKLTLSVVLRVIFEYENRRIRNFVYYYNDFNLPNRKIMPINKKIIKISKEEYERLSKDYNYIFDLYMSDNQHYVIGKIDDLKGAGVEMPEPY